MDIMELEQVVKNIDRRLSLLEQILPTLATKDDLKAFPTKDDPKGFATKDDLKAFATKDDLASAMTELRSEMREEGERTRQHFNAAAERLEGHVRLIAEGHVGLQQKLEETNRRFDTAIAQLDRRVTRLEAR